MHNEQKDTESEIQYVFAKIMFCSTNLQYVCDNEEYDN